MTTLFTTSKFRIPLGQRKNWQRYSLAIAAVLGCCAVRMLMNGYSDLSPFILFYPAVMFTAWYGGFGPGLAATFLSMGFAKYFYMPPNHSFKLFDGNQVLNLLLFAFVNVVVCSLTENLRRAVIVKNQGALDLLLSQSRVVSILESIRGCFFSVDRQEKIIHVNETCHKFLIDPPEELLGLSVWEAFPEWKSSVFFEKFHQVMRERQSIQFEFYDVRRFRWVDVHISPSSEGLSVHFFDVTSKKDMEFKLRLLVDSDLVGVTFGKSDGTINEANDVFLKMVGYSREELTQGKLSEFMMTPQEYEDIDRRKWEECRQGSKCEPWEKEYFRKDGTRVPVLVAMTFLNPAEGLWACFVADLTEHKAQQSRLTTEYEVTQILAFNPSLAAAMPKILERICMGLKLPLGIFWSFGPNFDVLRFGQAWAEDPEKYTDFILRCSKLKFSRGASLPGEVWKFKKAIWMEDISKGSEFIRKEAALRSGLQSTFSFPIYVGGEVRGVFEFFDPEIQKSDNDVLAMMDSIGSEIGQFIERKQAENELRLSQQNFNLALQAAKMGYWSWDLQTGEMGWSKYLEFFHGRQAEEFKGTFEDFLASVHPEDRAEVEQRLWDSLRTPADYQLEFRVLWPDQTVHWIDARGQVFYGEEGNPLRILGLLIDITDRKNSEEELRLNNEELERRVNSRTFELIQVNLDLKKEMAERQRIEKEALEIIQQEQKRFSAQLHDGLCQNLTGVLMLTKALTRKYEQKSMLESNDMKVITSLVDQSITEARDLARGLFPVELDSNSLMFSLRGLAQRFEQIYNVSCQFHCPDPILLGDNTAATHLFRIAQEAVRNAVSHGGANDIKMSLKREEKRIILQIKDNGRGFSHDLSTPSGVGLHIMHYRARMLEAKLNFETLSDGTLFTCTMPFDSDDVKDEA